MVKNRKCSTCGKEYSYCPDCSGPDRLKPSYFAEFCCEDCMTIWTTATKYNMNKLTKSEAKEIISKLTLKPTEEYVACVQRDLKVILAEEPKSKRSKKAVPVAIEESISIPVVADITEVTEDAVVVEVEPVIRSKAKTKSHEVVNKTEE